MLLLSGGALGEINGLVISRGTGYPPSLYYSFLNKNNVSIEINHGGRDVGRIFSKGGLHHEAGGGTFRIQGELILIYRKLQKTVHFSYPGRGRFCPPLAFQGGIYNK